MATRTAVYNQKPSTGIGADIRLQFAQFKVFVGTQNLITEPEVPVVAGDLQGEAQAAAVATKKKPQSL